MSTLPTNRFELKAIAYSTPEVGTYCDHLQVRYPTIADMKELRVMRVNLIKEMASTVQHEYVSVTVQDRNKGVAYICFERNRGDERRQALLAKSQSPSPYDAGAPQNVIPSSISSFHLGRNSLFSIASLDSAKKTYHAQDVVMLTVETLKYLYDTVARSLKLHGDTESLYLYQLVILANTLHNASIEYELFRKNCYWYVGVLFELLEGLLESKSTLGNCRNGVWGGISLYKQESLKDLARVKQEFVKNSAAFEHEIRERENNWNRQRETSMS